MKVYIWSVTLMNEMDTFVLAEGETVDEARAKAKQKMCGDGWISEARAHNEGYLNRSPSIELETGFDVYHLF